MKTILGKAFLPLVVFGVLFAGACIVNPPVHQAPTIEAESKMSYEVFKETPRGFVLVDEPVVTTPTTVTVTAPVTQSPAMAILYNILSAFAVAIGAALTALVMAVLTLLAKKFGIQLTQAEQDAVTGVMDTSVHKSEAWAAAHAATPTPNEKLNFAIQTARSLLSSDLAKKYTNEQLAHYAEESVYKAFNQTAPSTVPLTPIVGTTDTPNVTSALPIDAIVALIQAEISKVKPVVTK